MEIDPVTNELSEPSLLATSLTALPLQAGLLSAACTAAVSRVLEVSAPVSPLGVLLFAVNVMQTWSSVGSVGSGGNDGSPAPQACKESAVGAVHPQTVAGRLDSILLLLQPTRL